MTDSVNPIDIGQTDYMKLFMQELTYQDPLKPVDNREFMAQMAQFSALQQAAETNKNLDKLFMINYTTMSLSLLGKAVKIADAEGYGEVKAVRLNGEKISELRVKMDNGENSWISADRISEVI